MLKGTKTGTVKKVQPVSIHGQISLDVFVAYDDDPDQTRVARIGPESVERGVEAGDRVAVDFLVGVATSIKRLRP